MNCLHRRTGKSSLKLLHSSSMSYLRALYFRRKISCFLASSSSNCVFYGNVHNPYFNYFDLKLTPSECFLKFMTTGRKSTHYYDILGLTSKATQKQIKTSYYALSKKYHPDVASDKESHELFTEINEAYEVLGNIQKRRMYDRGMFNQRGNRRVYNESDYTQSYQAQKSESPFERGNRPPPPTGRTRIYNFDEFYKQHYNEVRERRGQELREFRKHQARMREYSAYKKRTVISPPLAFSLCLIMMLLAIMANDRLYDQDSIKRSKD